MVSNDFIRQMEGYGLTTAKILYRMPDHQSFLQTYVWQEYDLAPRFPVLIDFLDFWKRELAGPLHSVTVTHAQLIRPAESGRKFVRPPPSAISNPSPYSQFTSWSARSRHAPPGVPPFFLYEVPRP